MTSEIYIQNNILEQEAYLFSNYLIEREPSREMVKLYIDANRKLGTDTTPKPDVNILRFSRSHPWSIPFLDAATGFLNPESLLRKKIYTMAAVLEASTQYAEFFLPSNQPALTFIRQLASNALNVFIKMLIGIPMFLLIRGRG